MKDQYRLVEFNLNGKDVSCMVDARASLTDMLRNDFRMTSVKKGCEVGECGACNVLIDGECYNSCIYLAVWVRGKGPYAGEPARPQRRTERYPAGVHRRSGGAVRLLRRALSCRLECWKAARNIPMTSCGNAERHMCRCRLREYHWGGQRRCISTWASRCRPNDRR